MAFVTPAGAYGIDANQVVARAVGVTEGAGSDSPLVVGDGREVDDGAVGIDWVAAWVAGGEADWNGCAAGSQPTSATTMTARQTRLRAVQPTHTGLSGPETFRVPPRHFSRFSAPLP